MSHTPTPWEVLSGSIYQTDEAGGREVIHRSGIKGRGEDTERDANAAFIVRAANCHEELLEALRSIIQWSDACWSGGYTGNPKTPHPAWEDIQAARIVVARATGDRGRG